MFLFRSIASDENVSSTTSRMRSSGHQTTQLESNMAASSGSINEAATVISIMPPPINRISKHSKSDTSHRNKSRKKQRSRETSSGSGSMSRTYSSSYPNSRTSPQPTSTSNTPPRAASASTEPHVRYSNTTHIQQQHHKHIHSTALSSWSEPLPSHSPFITSLRAWSPTSLFGRREVLGNCHTMRHRIKALWPIMLASWLIAVGVWFFLSHHSSPSAALSSWNTSIAQLLRLDHVKSNVMPHSFAAVVDGFDQISSKDFDEALIASSLSSTPIRDDSLSFEQTVARALDLASLGSDHAKLLTESREVGHIKQLLADANKCDFNGGLFSGASSTKYLVHSCRSCARVRSSAEHPLDSLFDLIRAFRLAALSGRQLLIDSTACVGLGENSKSCVSSCCALLRSVQNLNGCNIKDEALDINPATIHTSRLVRALAAGFAGLVPQATDIHSSAKFAFFAPEFTCHVHQREWDRWEENQAHARAQENNHQSSPIVSRQTMTRVLAALVARPTDAISHLQEESLQAMRRAFAPDSNSDAALLQYMSVYIPSDVSSPPLTLSTTFRPLSSFVRAIRTVAANTGLRHVLVWIDTASKKAKAATHTIPIIGKLVKDSENQAKPATLEELRQQLPHLVIHDVSSFISVDPSSSSEASVHSHLLSLFLASHPQHAQHLIGSFAHIPTRLANFLIHAPVAHTIHFEQHEASGSTMPLSLVPIIPFTSLDSSSWYFDCAARISTGSVHSSLYSSIPGVGARPPHRQSHVGHAFYPTPSRLTPAAPRQAPVVRVVLLTGSMHSGLENIVEWFRTVSVSPDVELKRLMMNIFIQPQSVEEFTQAKAEFMQTLKQAAAGLQERYSAEVLNDDAKCGTLQAPVILLTHDLANSLHGTVPPATNQERLQYERGPPPFASLERVDVSLLSSMIEESSFRSMIDWRVIVASRDAQGIAEAQSQLIAKHDQIHVTNTQFNGRMGGNRRTWAQLAEEWKFMHFIRLLRDLNAIMDGQLRGLHPATYTVINFDRALTAPGESGEKIEKLLDVNVIQKSAPPEEKFVLSERQYSDAFNACHRESAGAIASGDHFAAYFRKLAAQKEANEPTRKEMMAINQFIDPSEQYVMDFVHPSSQQLGVRSAFRARLAAPDRNTRPTGNAPTDDSDALPALPSPALHAQLMSTYSIAAREPHLLVHSLPRSSGGVNEALMDEARQFRRFAARMVQQADRVFEQKDTAALPRLRLDSSLPLLESDLQHAFEILQHPAQHRDSIQKMLTSVAAKRWQKGLDQSAVDQAGESSEAFRCNDPGVRFLVVDSFNDMSTLPRVLTADPVNKPDGSGGLDSSQIKTVPLTSEFSLSGAYSLANQFHVLTRALSVALLTGRMLILPHIPNTIIDLLDLRRVSQCSLEDIGFQVRRHQSTHASDAADYSADMPPEVAVRFTIEPASQGTAGAGTRHADGKKLGTDPLDFKERIVQYSPSQYSFEWLSATQPMRTETGMSIPEFTGGLSGYFVSALSRHVKGLLKDSASDQTNSHATFVGVHMPLVAGSAPFESSSRLNYAVLERMRLMGLIPGSTTSDCLSASNTKMNTLPSMPVRVSYTASRSAHAGSGAAGRGEANSISAGDVRSFEANFHATSSAAHMSEASHLRHQAMMDEMHGLNMTSCVLRSLSVVSSPRHESISYFARNRIAGINTPHVQLLAHMMIDVIRMAESATVVLSHASEEGLLVSEIRSFLRSRHIRKSEPSTLLASNLLSHVADIHGLDYVSGLLINEEQEWKMQTLKRTIAQLVSVDRAAKKPAEAPNNPSKPLQLSNFEVSSLLNPLSLLSAPPVPPVSVLKRTFSRRVRFLFVAGIEGVGHHFMEKVLSQLRYYQRSSQDLEVTHRKMNLNELLIYKGSNVQEVDFLAKILLAYSGRVLMDQLRIDEPLSNLAWDLCVHSNPQHFMAAREQLVSRIDFVNQQVSSQAPRADGRPVIYVLNMVGAAGGMHSYPNGENKGRNMHHPDLGLLAQIFESAAADLRVLTVSRHPGASVASTVRRGHGISANKGDSINFMYQARILSDNLAVLEGDLRKIDSAFHVRLSLDHLSRFPYSDVQLISTHVGFAPETFIRSLIKTGLEYRVKAPTTWSRGFTLAQIEATRDHFSYASSSLQGELGIDFKSELSQPEIVQPIDGMGRSALFSTFARQQSQLNPIQPRKSFEHFPLSVDQLDTIVSSPLCTAPNELRPIDSEAEEDSGAVSLFGLEHSGEDWLRFAVEQATGLWTGGGAREAKTLHTRLSRWPNFSVPHKKARGVMLKQLVRYTQQGQVALSSQVQCLACGIKVKWNQEAVYKPNIIFQHEGQGTNSTEERSELNRNEAPTAANLRKVFGSMRKLISSPAPLNTIAPSRRRIYLIRHPLFIAESMANRWAAVHPFIRDSPERIHTDGARFDQWARHAVMLYRQQLLAQAFTVVAHHFVLWVYEHRHDLLPKDYLDKVEVEGLFKDIEAEVQRISDGEPAPHVPKQPPRVPVEDKTETEYRTFGPLFSAKACKWPTVAIGSTFAEFRSKLARSRSGNLSPEQHMKQKLKRAESSGADDVLYVNHSDMESHPTGTLQHILAFMGHSSVAEGKGTTAWHCARAGWSHRDLAAGTTLPLESPAPINQPPSLSTNFQSRRNVFNYRPDSSTFSAWNTCAMPGSDPTNALNAPGAPSFKSSLSPTAMFSDSLLIDALAEKEGLPWHRSIVVQERNVEELEAKLGPLIDYFGFDQVLDQIKEKAGPMWKEEADLARTMQNVRRYVTGEF